VSQGRRGDTNVGKSKGGGGEEEKEIERRGEERRAKGQEKLRHKVQTADYRFW